MANYLDEPRALMTTPDIVLSTTSSSHLAICFGSHEDCNQALTNASIEELTRLLSYASEVQMTDFLRSKTGPRIPMELLKHTRPLKTWFTELKNIISQAARSNAILAFRDKCMAELVYKQNINSSTSHKSETRLLAVLEQGAGRSDAILLCQAYHADDPSQIAALAAALAPSRERRMETLQQGAAFAATTRAVWGFDLPDMAYPVAVGRAAALAEMPLVPVTQVWLQAFLGNLVQAAQRLMPLGQTVGQRILADITPAIIAVAETAQTATLDDIGSATFAVDTASMQHETQNSRIFRS